MLKAKIDIGNLDREIIIIQPQVETSDVTNEDLKEWVEVETIWAMITPFKGNEAMIAERLTETHNIVATVRKETNLTNKMRFVLDTHVYGIVSVTPRVDRMFTDVVGQLIDNEIWT